MFFFGPIPIPKENFPPPCFSDSPPSPACKPLFPAEFENRKKKLALTHLKTRELASRPLCVQGLVCRLE